MHSVGKAKRKPQYSKIPASRNQQLEELPPSQLSPVDNLAMITTLKPKLLLVKQENAMLEKDIQERESKFLKREKEYREIIAELQDQIKLRIEFTDSGTQKMRQQRNDLHGKILKNIDSVQAKTTNVLAEQEKDIIRYYNTKIKELQQQFEKENKEQGER